jgi:hypothetical protein
MSFDDLSRLTDRARTKMIERALSAGRLPRATERVMKRESGPDALNIPQVELVSREASVRLSGSQDLSSELVRRIVQMEVLDSAKALARSEVEVGGGDDGGGDESSQSAPTAMPAIFEQWFAEMQGQGLNKAEIEEHLVSRIRAVRRGILGQSEERRLRRK